MNAKQHESDMQKMSNKINRNNVLSVRGEIARLISSFDPYVATAVQAEKVLTDIDHFPYTRRYRTSPSDFYPRVMEREAGFRPMDNECYASADKLLMHDSYPNNCFQTPCSTVDLCIPGKNPREPKPLPLMDFPGSALKR